ncbi:DUF292-domain-containing protein [Panus rudis PR-1116 ss-1]|nr:DUF292-domain-containing protein [Panus rudis PR-1116 ss-1]
MAPWSAAKAKVQLRLGVQRLRTLQEKKNAQAKASRRDIATLLEKGRVETARIKVENLINEDVYVELLELLELYCELLIARFGLLDQNTKDPDPGVAEGVCAIIYAAPRTELKELHVLRDILMHKYGREFSLAVMENKDGCVTERITKKLSVATPSPELVDAYLGEIAKGYGIAWSPPGLEPPRYDATAESSGGHDEQDAEDADINSGDSGGARDTEKKSAGSAKSPIDADTIAAEARSAGMRTPKLPDVPPTAPEGGHKEDKGSSGTLPPPPEDDFEALAKRFEALKKRR